MGGGTGNIRGQRNQSSANGSKTLASILASDSINGAGSVRRIYSWYKKQYGSDTNFYQNVLGLQYGEARNRVQFALSK
jgi:hypothetical protein